MQCISIFWQNWWVKSGKTGKTNCNFQSGQSHHFLETSELKISSISYALLLGFFPGQALIEPVADFLRRTCSALLVVASCTSVCHWKVHVVNYQGGEFGSGIVYKLSLPHIIGSDLTLEGEFVDLNPVYHFGERIIHLWIILVNWMQYK